MELEANEETSFVKLLAINNFSSHGRPLVDRINLYLISRPPTADRAHSHAARTEIIGVGLFFDLAAPRLEGREPHGDHDGEPLFASAGQVFVRRHTIHAAEAMTGQGRRSLGRTKLNSIGTRAFGGKSGSMRLTFVDGPSIGGARPGSASFGKSPACAAAPIRKRLPEQAQSVQHRRKGVVRSSNP